MAPTARPRPRSCPLWAEPGCEGRDIYDIGAAGKSKSGFGHPKCIGSEADIAIDIGAGIRQLAVARTSCHGSGSSRHSSRNRHVARLINEAKRATLLIDLLTLDEEAIDARTAHLRFDIDLLAERLVESDTRRSGAVGARVVPPPSYPWLFERTRCNAGRTERLKSGARGR
jgi:hypothetical protein